MARGPNPKHVATTVSGWVLKPSLSQVDAGNAYGRAIPDDAWSQIEAAFEKHGVLVEMRTTPRANENVKDPNSYGAGRNNADKDMERAFSLVEELRSNHTLVSAISDSWELNRGHGKDSGLKQCLDDASMALLRALYIIRDADPVVMELPSEADAKKQLVRKIAAALEGAGLPSQARDIRPLIAAFSIHGEFSAEAFDKWLSRALGQN